MTENASNSFSRKNKKKMLVFLKNAEKNASTIEKGLVAAPQRHHCRAREPTYQVMAEKVA